MSLFSYTLEIEKYADQIYNVINKNKTVIIKGPTGCGKSTYIPWLLRDKRVAIIEPRRISVISIYSILEKKIPNLGYKMRFDKKWTKNTTIIIFTDGCFLNEIDTLNYDYIIIDEVHERSVRTDLILSILKMKYDKKLILMSATVDTEPLEKFFGASTFSITCPTYPVEINYLEKPTSDYVLESYLTIKKIIKSKLSEDKKNILVFLPGEEDIDEIFHLCKKIPCILLYKMHSSISDEEQKKIFCHSSAIKVILSTNICETSITIPNVKYVIDTGLCKTKYFDKINYFGIQPINRNNEVQRLGRCNRIGPGVCYRLYTEFQELSPQIPDIIKSDASFILLYILNLGENIFTFPFLDYPTINNVLWSIVYLMEKNMIEFFNGNKRLESFEEIVCIDNNIIIDDLYELSKKFSFKITEYGKQIITLPFDVHVSHFYQQCIVNNVSYYGSLLISLISQDNYNFLTSPKHIEKKSDILYLVDIMENFLISDNKQDYCKMYNLPVKGMNMAEKIFKSLNRSGRGDKSFLEKIFSKCFSHNLCVRSQNHSFIMNKTALELYIHPTSGFFKRNDKKIVFVDVVYNIKPFARVCGKYFN